MKLIVEKHLGVSGRMVGYSKSRYRYNNSNNLIVFNANICTKSQGKIWYGDLDITKDLDLLKTIAKEINEDIIILSEHNARFENELKPNLREFIIRIHPDSSFILGENYSKYKETNGVLLLDNSIIYKDKKLDYIECKDIFKFRSNKKDKTPLHLFYDYVTKNINKKQIFNNINISSVYISDEIYDYLKFLTILYYKEVHKLDTLEANKTTMWEMFNYGPNLLEDNSNGIYIDKENLFIKEN